jgi:hypothetical protein
MADSITKQRLNIINRYRREVHDGELDYADVSVWAIREKLWEDSFEDKVEKCRKQLAAAARTQTFIDQKGREVRSNYSVRRVADAANGRKYIQTVWAHIDVATHPFMEQAFAQMHEGVINAAVHEYVNKAHYNEFRRGDNPEIPINLDLTNAVADKLQSTEYQPQDLFEDI